MNNRPMALLWILVVVLATIAALQALPTTPENVWTAPVVMVMWLLTLAGLLPRARLIIGRPVRWLRRRPGLYWLLLLVYISLGLGIWVVTSQPADGRLLQPVEYVFVLTLLWGLLYLLFFDLDRAQFVDMGSQLSRNRFSGGLVTLTTLVIILIAAETYLRIFYVTTDSFGFTAMNYHWYKNFYWGRYNSIGYRDYEPKPDQPGLIRVAVLGDSFAMGHGINNLDDTFPQILERSLGANYDVDVIATSGWDTDVELSYLMQYPFKPNIVILSYYLNDIDWLLADPAQNPDQNFMLPKNEVVHWLTVNFFVPSYLYYNLLQFTSPTRSTNHLLTLVDAHLNEDIWTEQSTMLDNLVWWTMSENKLNLIVLLWPHVMQVEASQPAVQRVKDFMAAKGVPVVDMSGPLRDHAGDSALIVNRFDTHPGLLAQKLAAEQLLAAVKALQ